MIGLMKQLLEEEKRLAQIIETVQKRLVDDIEGKLWISTTRGVPQYYYCTEQNVRTKLKGNYIPKSNIKLAAQLAQKEYDKAILKCAEQRLKQIQKITKNYNDNEIEHIYTSSHVARRKLIQPVEPTWEQKLSAWYKKEYVGKEFRDDVPLILTEKGERVRSKSEKILADYFYHHGILYKYECPLYLRGVGIVNPDFTFISPKTGREMYWEHEGRMSDPSYVEKAIRKINSYQNNGIFVGEDLLLTFETEKTVLNMKTVELMVEKYLM